MQHLMLPKSVRAVRVVSDNGAVNVYRKGRKKKKRKDTKWIRPSRRGARRLLMADKVGLDHFINRFDRSNRKRRDGWLTDAAPNVFRADRKSEKRLRKLFRLF